MSRPAFVLVAAALLAALALAPTANAAARIELSAEVLSVHPGNNTTACPYPSRIKVTDKGRAAGVIKVTKCAAAGIGAYYSGTTDLDVGAVTGPATFEVAFHPSPPNFTETKFGTGSIEKGQEGEQVRVKGEGLPTEVGAEFRLVLYPSPSAGRIAARRTRRAAGTIHLTGVVEGPMHLGNGEDCTYPSALKLLEGNRSVGVIHLRRCFLRVATDIKYRGTGELSVGELRGKLQVGINFKSEAQGLLPWGEGPAWKRVQGTTDKKVAEQIRVKSTGEDPPIPAEEGARMEVLLKPSGKFPPQTAMKENG